MASRYNKYPPDGPNWGILIAIVLCIVFWVVVIGILQHSRWGW